MPQMDDSEFDKALLRAAFARAERGGWSRMSIAAAARDAGLPLERARARFPNRLAVLMRFGSVADREVLASMTPDGTVRDRLFDLLMRRIDVLQEHRGGLLALLRHLPADPGLVALLALATRRSMRWMLEAAGISSQGLTGRLRAKGLMALWLWVIRAWASDESEDLSVTMAALDQALSRAEQLASWLPKDDPEPPEFPEASEPLPVTLPEVPPEPPPPPASPEIA